MIGDVLQPTHLIFILVVALLVLGPKRLPEVGRSLGKGLRDFRGALSGITEPEETPPTPAEPPDVQVTPVTPATTTVSTDDAVAQSGAAADQPMASPAAPGDPPVSETAGQPAPTLLPHVEPDEVHPVAPVADRSNQD